MPRLTIFLLGALQVILDGEPVIDFATDKARALLAYLAVEADKPHRRDELAGLLWPDRPRRKARQNLRQTLSYVRQAIGDQKTETPSLRVTRQTIQFDSGRPHWLDVAEFTRLVETCRRHRHRSLAGCVPCIRRMAQVADLYRGEFLEHFFIGDSTIFEEWASLQREWLHRRAIQALMLLSRYHERRGEYAQARHYARRQVELEPWREEAHRQLMRLLALDGERSAALAQYEACRRVLSEELDVEPSRATVALYEQIREATAQDLTNLESRGPVNLPPAPTSFVGREGDLNALVERLADPDCRLLTLVGPGGIGKTRLALRAAAEQVGVFDDGVVFVSLASLDSSDALVLAVADELGFAFYGRKEPAQQLLDYLREKTLLLVLDSMEHLLAGVDFLIDVLRYAPGVVLLVTSRERLNLQEEWVYSVGGLTYPELDVAAKEITAGVVEKATSYSAVNLFCQRAGRVERHFSLSEENLGWVVRICRLVEGMPLAIEMAAAWAAVRSCEAIGREIERSCDVLATSLCNVPQRQRSIRATFEYSWCLLVEEERRVFRRLSVFRGSFEEAAVEAVAGAAFATLAVLVGKSLLRRTSSGRYHMHELLRQYAAEKLQENDEEQEETRARHAAYYAAFLQRQEQTLKGARQREAVNGIRAEIDNVRAGWHWAVERLTGRSNRGAALDVIQKSLESLYVFYRMQGWYQEGTETFAQAAAALLAPERDAEDLDPDEQRLWGQLLARQGKCCEFTVHSDQAQQLFESSLAILQRLGARREMALPLHGLGYMAHIRGEYTQAEAYFQQSLALYREHGDLWGMAVTLGNMCLVSRRRGAFAEAKARCLESLEIRRQIGDRQGIASVLNNLALVQCTLGEYIEAQQVLKTSLEMCRELGYKDGIANALTHLGHAAFRLGDAEEAKHWMREALTMCREIGDTWGMAIALNNLGYIAIAQADYAGAERLCRDSVELYRQAGIRAGLANTLANLGQAYYHLGQRDGAWESFREALEIAQEASAIPTVLKTLVGLARLWADTGKREKALELLAFAMQQSAIGQAIKEQAEDLFSELGAAIPPEEVRALKTRAQSRALGDVVAEVLKNIAVGPLSDPAAP